MVTASNIDFKQTSSDFKVIKVCISERPFSRVHAVNQRAAPILLTLIRVKNYFTSGISIASS